MEKIITLSAGVIEELEQRYDKTKYASVSAYIQAILEKLLVKTSGASQTSSSKDSSVISPVATTMEYDHLRELESRSIYIIREAYKHYKNLGMLWSIGKDSTT